MPEDALHHVDFGGTDGPDIVLVHGLGGSHLNWDLLAPLLAAHGHVVALDLPGFGLSTPTGRAATVGRNVAVLEDFLRTRTHPPVVLVGNSMGGLVSVLVTARSPGLVRALVLLDPALPAPSRVLRSPAAAAQLLVHAIPGVGERVRAARRRRRGARGTVLDTLRLCGVDPARLPPGLLERSVALTARQGPGTDRAFLSASRSLACALLRARRYRAAREAIDVPVLLVHGDRDALVPVAAARAVAADHPSWHYVELPGVGHLPQLQEPATVARLVDRWLRDLHDHPARSRRRDITDEEPAMDTDHRTRHDVVVGVDGSEPAWHAVGWAAAEARLRGLPLRIVHADPAAPGRTEPLSGPEVLARAVTVARRAEPGVEVSTVRTARDAAASLLDAAADGAALLVVGMGGTDRPGEVLVGSVALDVSGRAACPVAVVRGGPVPQRGPVLVGVDTFGEDGLRHDAAALSPAFADARRHGGRVTVLHARYVTDPDHTPDDEQAADVAVRNRLLDELAPWTSRHPEVPVEVSVVRGNPARALLRAAEGSRLVVLGTHGDGPYLRDIIGSTSREVLRRSPATVLVVNPDTVVDPETVAAGPEPDVRAGARRTPLDDPHDPGQLY